MNMKYDRSVFDSWPILPLNDLVRHSPWPARLLGASDWVVPTRTRAKVEQEYNQEKYRYCLKYFTDRQAGGNTPSFDEIKLQELFQDGPKATQCVSVGEELRLVTSDEAAAAYYYFLVDTLTQRQKECRTVVELGCGYGYNLYRLFHARGCPGIKYLGGEYAANAVTLGNLLSCEGIPIQVHKFDYYDAASYASLFDQVDERAFVFTCHSIEQLPSAAPFLDHLSVYRDRIQAVVHLEPVAELHANTLLGLMRQQYARANDYNQDLLSELRSRANVKIEALEADRFGLNPLNPTSILQWSFV